VAALTFRSKIDAWLLAVMLGVPLAILSSLVPTLGRDSAEWTTVLVVGLLAAGLPLWLLANTRYVLSADTLRIFSGPFRWNVRIGEITSVTPTRSVLSSPSLSLQRLRIEYATGRSVMISPADPDAFLRALDERRRAAVQRSAAGGRNE
jgi:hypothetical protein